MKTKEDIVLRIRAILQVFVWWLFRALRHTNFIETLWPYLLLFRTYIAFKIYDSTYFKALFPAVSIDIRVLLFIKECVNYEQSAFFS